MGLGAFAASELDKVFSGYQPNAADSPRRLYRDICMFLSSHNYENPIFLHTAFSGKLNYIA
jgi:hypothetical protein